MYNKDRVEGKATLPKVRTADLRRIAKKNGWRKLKEGGCHEIWTNGMLTEPIKRLLKLVMDCLKNQKRNLKISLGQ